MLEKAKRLLQPSARSAVPPFMVMDVAAAATRLEAQGRRIVHMEVGQPAAGAPAAAIAAARAALSTGPSGPRERRYLVAAAARAGPRIPRHFRLRAVGADLAPAALSRSPLPALHGGCAAVGDIEG